MSNPSPVAVEEQEYRGTTWVALRARSPMWTWLTPDEAVEIAKVWLDNTRNNGGVLMIWYLGGAALVGAAIAAIGITVWWCDEGRSDYEAWALRGGRGLSNLE